MDRCVIKKKKDKKRKSFVFSTGAKVVRTGFDEVKKTGSTIELGEEECGIGLRVCGFDPLKAWSYGAILVATFA